VDCGTCISVCPTKAIKSLSGQRVGLAKFKYKIVIPSPVLYSQFEPQIHPYLIHLALRELGFDEVIDVHISTAAMATVVAEYIDNYSGRLPLISSFCPSVIRLIQVKYPDLVELIIPLDVPREVTAREIRRSYPQKLGLHPEAIGITYIAPCPAKIVSVRQPAEKEKSWIDDAISIKEIFSVLFPKVMALRENFNKEDIPENFAFDASWATLGRMSLDAKRENWMAVSSIDHVKKIFTDIENSHLRNIDFVEAHMCMLGCIGGPYNIENPYVARMNSIKQQIRYEKPVEVNLDDVLNKYREGYYHLDEPILPRPTKYFDSDLETSIKRMREIEKVYQKLRQIDCGCCGTPTCMAFAEDLVRGELELTDCIFLGNKGIVREKKDEE
jgi:iron only hydrogenase large subunit-like protein